MESDEKGKVGRRQRQPEDVLHRRRTDSWLRLWRVPSPAIHVQPWRATIDYIMETQTYANHRQFVPLFHAALAGILVLTLIGACVNLYESLGDHSRLYNAALILVLDICGILSFWFIRTFPLKAQDRAIRAEENLRHFAMTGKLLDPRLDVRQIIALRFASDAEFPDLARRAADEKMAPDAIKRAVKQWRPDYYRV